MSRLFHRLYSTTSPSAASTASLFLAQTASAPPRTHTQTLDLNQLHLLSSTLSRRPPASPRAAVPACHHLVYFTPAQPESELGRDGTDTSYSPPAPFTRRMWAGGELAWAGPGNLLRVGQTVRETTRVRSAEGKRTRRGEEMVVVGVEKVFENEGGWALLDRRCVVASYGNAIIMGS
jgi:hydroxyacyl-ACP dehydratase HTD2-like protein with hotdog domain